MTTTTETTDVTSGEHDGSASKSRTIAIVGGGASGVLTAIQILARHGDPDLRVRLHEAGGVPGRGVAYGTTDERHLLNVRARHMSAFADIPSDLLEWAARTGRTVDPIAFLPRMTYADYLRDTLAEQTDGRLEVCASRVTDVVPVAGGFEVHATTGDTATDGDSEHSVTHASSVILAYGNQAPRALTVAGEELPAGAWHLADPWDVAALRALPEDATVVLVGTGLTAIDTAITLLEDSPARRVVMTSRHGLLPRGHVAQLSTAWVSPPIEGPVTADGLATYVTGQIEAARRQGVDWRAVVDGLRAPTQSLWLRLDLDERRRFLSVHARNWEVRRHRMAPDVAARIAGYQEAGRLRVVAGGLSAVDPRGATALVTLGPDDEVEADAVVNCTGPLTDVTASTDPLLAALRERGLLTADPLALGLACTPAGEILDAAGEVVPSLYAVGPPRKGTLYESTAIPEIRTQAAELSTLLLDRAASGPATS